ncbi:MAG: sigma-70 family RNA polymerase sigma factor [Bacteroidota bacterium]
MQKDATNRMTFSDEASILLAIKKNDENTLKRIYQDNFRKVEVYVLKNNGDTEQAKDIYQEAFVAFWNNVKQDKFRPTTDKAIGGYLYTIAKNKWTDHLRSAHYKKVISVEEHNQLTPDAAEQDPSAEATNEKMQQTMAAFDQLGNECKVLLTKFYYGKQSLNEIAQELKMEPASVRNKKYRCMQRLRKQVFK